MIHGIYRVCGFEQTGRHSLRVDFDDGTAQEIDFEPVLRGALYAPLRAPSVFAAVRIHPEMPTLVWPNGADFDAATLHDWPEGHEDFVRMAASGWRWPDTKPQPLLH